MTRQIGDIVFLENIRYESSRIALPNDKNIVLELPDEAVLSKSNDEKEDDQKLTCMNSVDSWGFATFERIDEEIKISRKDKLFSSACWRRYFSIWEVVDNKLYLMDLAGKFKFVSKVSVLATWVTGRIEIMDQNLAHRKKFVVSHGVHGDFLNMYVDKGVVSSVSAPMVLMKRGII